MEMQKNICFSKGYVLQKRPRRINDLRVGFLVGLLKASARRETPYQRRYPIRVQSSARSVLIRVEPLFCERL